MMAKHLPEICIPVVITVALTDGWAGERWDVKDVVDETDARSLGDIGIREFDAYSNFPELLMERVLSALMDADKLSQRAIYSVDLEVICGGSSLGTASRWFVGPRNAAIESEE